MISAHSHAWVAFALIVQSTGALASGDEGSLAAFTDTLRLTPRLSPKGRVQDPFYNPNVPINHPISARPSESVDFLVELVASAEPLPESVLDYWPAMTVGDLALVIALDLFLDSESNPTVSSLTWSQLLEAEDRSDSAYGQLQAFLEERSRDELQRRLRGAWAATRESLTWDTECHCFRQGQAAPVAVVRLTTRSSGRALRAAELMIR